jgi:hypothetical protein
MDDAVGIGILGAGWITRAHGHALRCDAIVASVAESRRVGIDELTAAAARA